MKVRIFFALLIVLLIVLMAITSVQVQDEGNTPSDYDRLMAGETVELDWGEYVILSSRPEEVVMPPAAELLRQFVDEQSLIAEDPEKVDFVFDYLISCASDEYNYRRPGFNYLGIATTSASWDAETRTLFLQSSRYLPNQRSNGDNTFECFTGFGTGVGQLWRTEREPTMTNEGWHAGEPTMPSVSRYRLGAFTVVYLPPIDTAE